MIYGSCCFFVYSIFELDSKTGKIFLLSPGLGNLANNDKLRNHTPLILNTSSRNM